MTPLKMTYSPSVKETLEAGQGVVALESTVITHGLPYPQNVETAVLMETAVREGGATPATIGVIAGTIIVGLSEDEMDYLGQQAGSPSVRKCSRRDLPIVLAAGADGSTTVAGTMIVAHLAGIELFATGGIGGVHRGHPFDVSADLTELGRTPITVVCSGAKSILDLPATLEVLETEGVTILGYRTDTLPAFYARSSGLPVDARVESAEEAAHVIQARRALTYQGGMLVANPVPQVDAMPFDEAEAAIVRATREADEQGIQGPASTPWLLRRVVELTDGRSLRANVSLLRHNGYVAAQITKALVAAKT